ncbi:MAG: SMP-30/gluconolactonase/LRE family protein [Alphaproteobacteria bacterium]
MAPLIPISSASVFVDGIFNRPKLAHPEGVAVHEDGSVWCGTENGHLLRIAADGSSIEEMGSSDGFHLGLAFDSRGDCFVCDLKHAAIFRFVAATGEFARFASGGIKTPNYPVVDEARGVLYVSDSNEFGVAGGGIYRFNLETGEGGLWYGEPMEFANGMAMAADGSGLYVVESTAARVSFVGIGNTGKPASAVTVVDGLDNIPDGVLEMPNGDLLVSCYEPSRIYRYGRTTGLEVLIEDTTATVLAHPTNIARSGDRLYTANLGRWHLSVIDLSGLDRA